VTNKIEIEKSYKHRFLHKRIVYGYKQLDVLLSMHYWDMKIFMES